MHRFPSGSKFTLVAVVATAALFAADTQDAFAGRGRARRNVETVRLARPADGGDAGPRARGNITITHGRDGDDAVLRVKGLDRRASYEVVDGQTGERLGTVRTNRRGAGAFDLTPGVGKRALRADSADGENGGAIPNVVDVVDPDTGDPVLTGDTTGDLQALYGFATVGNATESATITLGSDPFTDTQYFSFTYFAAPEDGSWFGGMYDFYADTAEGGSLPLGKSSVLDLANLRFQVRDADGETVFRGTLPDVEAYDIDDPGYPDPGEPKPDPDDPSDGGDDGNGGGGLDLPFDFDDWFSGGDDYSNFLMNGFLGMPMKAGVRDDGSGEEPAVTFTLWLETEAGFEKAGDLVAPDDGYEPCDPWGDYDDWDDFDWGDYDGGDDVNWEDWIDWGGVLVDGSMSR